jgi:predicted glycosyltransferase
VVLGDSWELIYRPVRASIDEYFQLTEELKEFGNIKIQKPDSDRIGLDFFKLPLNTDHACKLKDMFNSVEVLVCSGTTSLCVEAAFLGIPAISYYPLNSNKLRTRNSNLYLNSEGNFIGFESLPIAQNIIQLQENLLEILSSNEKRLKIINGVLRNWHYADSDFINFFQSIVFNDY